MKSAILFLILAAATAAHLGIGYSHGKAAVTSSSIEISLPQNIGPYRQIGADLDPGDRTRELLQSSAILMRNYAGSSGRPIQLSVVQAVASRASLHFPEVCLVGQGWEISEQYMAPVGLTHTAKRLVIFNGDRQEAVLYWFRTGDRYTGSFFLNSWYWILDTVSFKDPQTALIRVSTYIRKDKQEAFQALEDFAGYLGPLLLESRP
jgi:EpsI family protein